MIRRIACPHCAHRWSQQVGHFDGETVTVTEGYARRALLCDDCGKSLDAGRKCAAVSVTTPLDRSYAAPGWETDYITPAPPPQFQSAIGPLPRDT